MRVAWDILKRLFVWIFPVLLFDGCLNRDPYLKVDEHFTIAASCGGCPMYLSYRNKSAPVSLHEPFQNWHWSLGDIDGCRLSEAAIIGDSSEGPFIADRFSGELRLFSSRDERDQVLRLQYHLESHEFSPPSALMWMKSRALWPWIYIYYFGCFVLVPWLTFTENKRLSR